MDYEVVKLLADRMEVDIADIHINNVEKIYKFLIDHVEDYRLYEDYYFDANLVEGFTVWECFANLGEMEDIFVSFLLTSKAYELYSGKMDKKYVLDRHDFKTIRRVYPFIDTITNYTEDKDEIINNKLIKRR